MSIVGTILGGGLIYAFLGQIADLVFDCAYFMVENVLLADGKGLLTNFQFLVGTSTLFNDKGIGLNNSVVSLFLNLIWVISWVLFAISASIAIIKLILNQTKNTSGAGVKVAIRILIVAGFLSIWFPMLSQFLDWVSNLAKGKLYNAGTQSLLNMNDLTTALKNYSDTNLIDWNDFMSNPGQYILECILAFGLGSSLIACVITYIERYIAFAFYIYLSPLTLALAANEETGDNLKSWIAGLFPQILTMITSILFLYFGIQVLNSDTNLATGVTETTAASVCFKCAVGMVFFGLSRSTEKLFNTLGFKTTHVGDAAKGALAGTATAMMTWQIGRNIENTASNVVEGTVVGNKMHEIGVKGDNVIKHPIQTFQKITGGNDKSTPGKKAATNQSDNAVKGENIKNNPDLKDDNGVKGNLKLDVNNGGSGLGKETLETTGETMANTGV